MEDSDLSSLRTEYLPTCLPIPLPFAGAKSPTSLTVVPYYRGMPLRATVLALTVAIIMVAVSIDASASLNPSTTFALKGAAAGIHYDRLAERFLKTKNDEGGVGNGYLTTGDNEEIEGHKRGHFDESGFRPVSTSASTTTAPLPAPSSDDEIDESLLISLLRSWIA